MNRFEEAFISDREGISILEFLADELPLSKSRLKKVIQTGGVWLKRKNQEPCRLHENSSQIHTGDEIHIYYDPDFMAIRSPLLELVEQHKAYSIWKKPEGISDEISLYCDHLNLERVIEKSLPEQLDCYWFDPLSSQINGLSLMAHSQNMAAQLDRILQNGDIHKDYHVTLDGEVPPSLETIELANGKHVKCRLIPSRNYKPVSHLVLESAQHLESECIQSLADLGYPLHENTSLQCISLSLLCPVEKRQLNISLHKE